jgi:exo-beta-1,3-glucanase (GH17 family)
MKSLWPVLVCCIAACGGTSTGPADSGGIPDAGGVPDAGGDPDAGVVPSFKVGGTVSGLAHTLVLANDGGDALTLTTTGPFTFGTAIKQGESYAVTVQTQPGNQTCTVTQGSGTVGAAVTNVAVTCAVTITQAQRALPAVYATGKAVGYSAYRAGGPGAGELPGDANILQDLQLLNAAGFNLIRLFGADAASTAILRVANANFPAMSFQLGIFLEGAPGTCVDAVNTSEIDTAISLANQYLSVATVSVGNETSFAANLPVGCLASYIRQVRGAVAQPVTADDDYTFYAGLTSGGEKPDTILPLLDFASIHLYPFADTSLWDYQQTTTAAGTARATAMMNASLVEAKTQYAQAANYPFSNSAGLNTTTGASMPIVIGESGWKARPTNQSQLEKVVSPAIANPVNAKWYLDLLGTWTGNGAPKAIFYFDAFDESWKGIDDGWGLWDSSRGARYALCGTGANSACNADLYANAGWFH